MQGGQLLHFASRALTDTEKFYCQILLSIVSRNDCILVSAALHPKDPDYQMKLRIWAKVQPLGVPQHLYGDQR